MISPGRIRIFPVVLMLLVPGVVLAQSVALSAGTASASAGASAGFALSLATSGGAQPAAAQWTISYSAADVAAISVTAAGTAVAAGKSVSCANASGSSITCLLYGLNATPIAAGQVAQVNVTLASTTSSSATNLPITAFAASDSTGMPIPGTASGAQVTVQSPAPTLSALSCAPASISGAGTVTCTASLAGTAPSAGLTLALSTNNASLSVPATAAVAPGASSVSFSAIAVSVTADQTATISASLSGSSKSATVTLAAPPLVLTGLSCASATVAGGSSLPCTVVLSKAAPAGGLTVSLSEGAGTALSLPASVTVAAGATSATFNVTPLTATIQTVTITASANRASVSCSVTTTAGQVFSFAGNASSAVGVTNGSLVTAEVRPSNLAGKLVVNGTGSVNFLPPQNGGGVYFLNCCANTSNAYIKFSGAGVGTLFNLNQGQLSWSLTSRSNFAQRALASSYRTVFDLRDGNMTHLMIFDTQVSSGRLVFIYSIGSTVQNYYIPQGTEDQVFGAGMTMQITLSWSNSTMKLYVNGVLVKSAAYSTSATPNWTAASLLDIGAYEYFGFGGYDSCDDIISNVVFLPAPAQSPVQSPAPTLSTLTCAPASISGAGTVTCTASLSGTAPAAGLTLALSTNNANLRVPATASVAPGGSSVAFSATALSVTTDQTAAVTASVNGSSQSAGVTLTAPPVLTGISCSPAAAGSGSTPCTVSLSKAASAGGIAVSLSVPSGAALSLPASVTVAAGATSATFNVMPVAATIQTVTITASSNGVSVSCSVSIPPRPVFSFAGNASDASGVTNGSLVTAEVQPSNLAGKLVVNGTGSANFLPPQNGGGVYFLNCCANTSNAYIKFSGAGVGTLFNLNQGQVSWSLTSRSNFAQRALASSYRTVFDLRDGNMTHLMIFDTQVSSGRLVFIYSIGSTVQNYYIPQGTEDQVFGAGMTMQITLSWSNSTMKLYVNGVLVKSAAYSTSVTPNWTAASLLDIGAYEYFGYGGYDSCDDIISNVVFLPAPAQ